MSLEDKLVLLRYPGTMLKNIVKAVVFVPALVLLIAVAASCTQLGLNYASLEVENKLAASPAIEAVSVDDWQSEVAPRLKAEMSANVFGPVPLGVPTHVKSHTVIDPAFMDGRGSLEEYVLQIGDDTDAVQFHLAAVFPQGVAGPVPLVIGQTFSRNPGVFRQWDLYPGPQMESRPDNGEGAGGMMMGLVTFIFGEYIEKAPISDYLDRGYAFANFYAGEIVPDRGTAGRQALETFPAGADGDRPTGAIAAWAAGYFAAIDALGNDERIDPARLAVIGHSRHGKSALVAGAWDDRISLVIAHQSGTGGASLNRRKRGESVRQITRSYPHWFDPAYAAYAERVDEMPVDQHMLLSLIAPRRLLLGNGRRDVWSDPNGAFRAAIGANAAWQAFSRNGLSANRMTDFRPGDDVAFFLRPGGHGIVRADVDAFLAFFDASFTSV